MKILRLANNLGLILYQSFSDYLKENDFMTQKLN